MQENWQLGTRTLRHHLTALQGRFNNVLGKKLEFFRNRKADNVYCLLELPQLLCTTSLRENISNRVPQGKERMSNRLLEDPSSSDVLR